MNIETIERLVKAHATMAASTRAAAEANKMSGMYAPTQKSAQAVEDIAVAISKELSPTP